MEIWIKYYSYRAEIETEINFVIIYVCMVPQVIFRALGCSPRKFHAKSTLF